MEFTEKDRELITQHDVKLGILCGDVKELKEEFTKSIKNVNKDMKDSIKVVNEDMKDGLKIIFNKLDSQAIACPEYRIACRKEVAEKIEGIEDKVDSKVGRFFTKKVLMSVLGLIVLSLISLSVYTGKLTTSVSLNKQRIDFAHPKMNYNKGEEEK